MQVSIRPYLTAGVALAGAGAIALSPINPVDPLARDLQLRPVSVSNAAVELTATVDPITWYTQVYQRTVDNIEALVRVLQANPAPVLQQIQANQSKNWGAVSDALKVFGNKVGANLQTQVNPALEAFAAELSSMDIEGAVNVLLNLPINILGGPGGFLGVMSNLTPVTTALKDALIKPLANTQAVILALWGNGLMKGVASLLTLGGLFGPLMSGVGSVGTAIQDVIDPVLAGDILGAAQALINAPATVLDGVLNGGYGPEINALIKLHYTGILTGNVQKMPLSLGYMAGPIQTVLNVRDAVAKAIGATLNPVPPKPASAKTVADVPGQDATTLSLDVTPAPAPAPDAAARMSLQAPSSGTGESTGDASDGGPAVGTVSDNANRRAGRNLHVDKTADRLQQKIKAAGDQTQSNLQKVGDNLNKMMKTKPGKHRVGATSGGGSDAGSESGSGSES